MSVAQAVNPVIRIGARATRRVRITREDIVAFGDLINDHNPIHHDVEAAKAAGFPDTICYGMYAGSLFSGLMAHEIPGPNTILLSQNLRFVAPIFGGDEVDVTVDVLQFRQSKGLVRLRTIIEKSDADSNKKILCIEGTAVGMNKSLVFEGESEWSN